MISMTIYWQQFKDCIDNLPKLPANEEYTLHLKTANTMIDIGLTIEHIGITAIKQIGNQLHEKARQYGHDVRITKDKEYHFYLPKISNNESLIFAIIYYQHLCNYEQVSYQGSINWFRQMVVDGVNEKKVSTRYQSIALLEHIRHYCQSQNVSINETQVLKNKDEQAKDYVNRISKMIHEEKKVNIATEVPEQNNEKSRLEGLLNELKNKKEQLNTKIGNFFNKFEELDQEKQSHLKLANEWQRRWFITRVFYWFISWFVIVPELRAIEIAQQKCNTLKKELKQSLPPDETIQTYHGKLKKEMEELVIEQAKVQGQINIQIELELSKQKKDEPVIPIQPTIKIDTPKIELIKEEKPQASNLGSYYGFFREHLPNRGVMTAIAVCAAAIVVQQLVYS